MSNNHALSNLGNEPTDDPKIVDGGFISWVFGSSHERIWLWKSSSWTEFSAKRNRVIVMDHPHLFRQDIFPGYKGHRKEKAAKDPVWAEKVQAVREFRQLIRTDNRITTLELDGYEADDLITAFSMLYWAEFGRDKLNVIAADKDLLQCDEFLALEGFGATEDKDVSFSAFRSKQAVAIQPHLLHPSQILLVLTLLGDKSDDIPRLVPPRRLDMMVDVLDHSSPWVRALELFGEDVKSNLYLTVLPGPWAFEEIPDHDTVFERVDHCNYLPHKLSRKIRSLYQTYLPPLFY